jgi:hypothetical protein
MPMNMLGRPDCPVAALFPWGTRAANDPPYLEDGWFFINGTGWRQQWPTWGLRPT